MSKEFPFVVVNEWLWTCETLKRLYVSSKKYAVVASAVTASEIQSYWYCIVDNWFIVVILGYD